jgi:hypothetical protein
MGHRLTTMVAAFLNPKEIRNRLGSHSATSDHRENWGAPRVMRPAERNQYLYNLVSPNEPMVLQTDAIEKYERRTLRRNKSDVACRLQSEG